LYANTRLFIIARTNPLMPPGASGRLFCRAHVFNRPVPSVAPCDVCSKSELRAHHCTHAMCACSPRSILISLLAHIYTFMVRTCKHMHALRVLADSRQTHGLVMHLHCAPCQLMYPLLLAVLTVFPLTCWTACSSFPRTFCCLQSSRHSH
jgi:hypothetical protein